MERANVDHLHSANFLDYANRDLGNPSCFDFDRHLWFFDVVERWQAVVINAKRPFSGAQVFESCRPEAVGFLPQRLHAIGELNKTSFQAATFLP